MSSEPTANGQDAADTAPAVGRRKLGAELRRLATGKVTAPARRRRAPRRRAEHALANRDRPRPARTAYLTLLLDLYGVGDQKRRAELADLARHGQRQSWWAEHGELLPPGTGQYLDLEGAASQIISYSVQVVPSQVQTADYATAAIQATRPAVTTAQAHQLTTIQQRQQELRRRSPAHCHLIIDETALRTCIGSPSIMADQLTRLLAADPTLTLQVLPLSTTRRVLSPPLTMLSFATPSDPDVSCAHGPAGQVTLTSRSDDVRATRSALATLTHIALPPASSADLIELAATRWKEQAAHRS